MAASYPGAIKSFSAITTSTVMAASLFTDAAAEIEAIETELGLLPHGNAGSLAERLLNCMDADGGILGHLRQADGATDGLRLRIRAGISEVLIADATYTDAKFAEGTITFSPPLAALPNVCHASVNLQYVESDRTATDTPILVAYVHNSGTTTSFQYRVGCATNAPPDVDSRFLLHWVAWERSSNNDVGY